MTYTITNKNNYDEKLFNRDSREFCVHWDMGREAARKANIKLNDMVAGLHEQHPNWAFTKIAKTLWLKHQHLEGFTPQTIRKKLDDNNLNLIDSTKKHTPKPKEEEEENDNNVLEQSGYNGHNQKVIEESSTFPGQEEIQMTEEEADEILKDVPEPTDEIKEFSKERQEESKEVRQLNDQIESSNKIIQDLEERIRQLSIQKTGTIEDKFTFEYDFEITNEMLRQIKNNGRIMPLIATAYPDKKTGYVRFDNARLKESIKKKIIVKQ
jgi:hypothetical protein